MRVGRYSVGWPVLASVGRLRRDARRVREQGIPPVEGATPLAIARAVLRDNARVVFRAGAGHFHPMWVADMGKAFGGARLVLPHDYLARQLSRMVATAVKLGRLPTCFSETRAYDMPWPRADGVPWLLHMVDLLGDAGFVATHARDLDRVYADWVRAHVDERTGLLHERVTGDWMDTLPRPSSTYNNLCALRAYHVAARLGLDLAPTFAREATAALLEQRWTGTHLRDHARAGDYLSADANVPALYLGVLPPEARRRIADTLERSGLMDPVPMRVREGAYGPRELPLLTRLMVPAYHSTTWLHLGLMALVGLQREGRDVRVWRARVEASVMAHRNFLETLEPDGSPHATPFLATEYGFSMSAGLYVELAS